MTSNTPATAPLFSIVEGAQAVISERGVYKRADVYELGGHLYAAYGRGFVRLAQSETTSKPSVKWHRLVGVDYVEKWNGLEVTGPIHLVAAE